MKHWAYPYLDLPWEKGAQGPDAFNCWGLVRYLLLERFGIVTQHIELDEAHHAAIVRAFITTSERKNWVEVARPIEGDIVEMGSAKHPHHVGLWVDADGGGVLHCVEGVGVIFTKKGSLVVSGWGKIKYYRHVSRV